MALCRGKGGWGRGYRSRSPCLQRMAAKLWRPAGGWILLIHVAAEGLEGNGDCPHSGRHTHTHSFCLWKSLHAFDCMHMHSHTLNRQNQVYIWNSLSLSFIMIVVNSHDTVGLVSQGSCERVSGQLTQLSHASLGQHCIVILYLLIFYMCLQTQIFSLVWSILNIVSNCSCGLKLSPKLCILYGLCRWGFEEIVRVIVFEVWLRIVWKCVFN